MTFTAVRIVFAVAGIYDLLIGLAFLFAGPQIFAKAEVPPPNHWGYLQFCAILLIIFGIMFFAVAQHPVLNRNLMLYGILLKLSYVGLVCFYWATSGCPTLFKPFAVIDAVMLVLFVLAYMKRPASA